MPKVENIILEQWMPWAWGWGGSIYIYICMYIFIYIYIYDATIKRLSSLGECQAVTGSAGQHKCSSGGGGGSAILDFSHTKHARVMAAFRELQGCEIQGVPGAWRYIRQHLRGWHSGIVCACGGLGHLMLSGRS